MFFLIRGKYDEPISFDVDPSAMIKDYEKQGYVLVSNNYTNDSIYTTTPSSFEVHLKHGVIKVDPENPGKPDQPINPGDPNKLDELKIPPLLWESIKNSGDWFQTK